MNELRDRWLAALRSGDYIQGKNVLRSSMNTFCCLGVLCDLADPSAWRIDGGQMIYGDVCRSHPPERIVSEAGLQSGHVTTLMIMNDAKDKNFAEIADWIEENVGTPPAPILHRNEV